MEISPFRYIHVAVTDAVERGQIHKTICNIVRLPKMQQICDELYRLMKDKKVLCSINPDAKVRKNFDIDKFWSGFLIYFCILRAQ